MRLNPAEFNRFIANVGQAVAWRRAHDCPCRDPNSGAPTPACTMCVNGRIWEAPIAGVLAIAGQKVQHMWTQFGLYESGDVVCTLPSDSPVYAMGEFDRVVFTQSSIPFSEVLVNDAPRLRGVVATIDRVFWASEDLSAPVEGAIPEIGEFGALEWLGGVGAPPAGASFTVTGRRRPEYFSFKDYPQDRAHHGGLDLPRRVVLRLFDLYGRAA
jgi:hypothetical protein